MKDSCSSGCRHNCKLAEDCEAGVRNKTGTGIWEKRAGRALDWQGVGDMVFGLGPGGSFEGREVIEGWGGFGVSRLKG